MNSQTARSCCQAVIHDSTSVTICSRTLLNGQSVEKAQHISDMKQGFPVSGFGIPKVDDAHKLSRGAFLPEELVQVGVLEAGVRTRLPVGRNGRIAIWISPSGRALFDVDSGQLPFHALCSTMFRIHRICLRRTQNSPLHPFAPQAAGAGISCR